MRKMKPSGVEWIGDIPQEWEIALIKYSIKWKSEKGKPDATVLSLYRDYGIVPKDSRDDNHNVTSLDTSGYKVVDIGDFVINKMKAWQGSMAISSYKGIVSPAYHVCEITDDKVYRNYFHYLLRSDLYITEYTRLSKGMRIGQWDLDFNDFKNLPFLIPPISEQQRIAEFLDRKCAEIDSIIGKTKATVEEYKALKQAVITQAVTKGIRPDRPMKDSGVEWIGDIPQEWDIVKMKHLGRCRNGLTYSPENVVDEEIGTLVLRSSNIKDGKLMFSDNVFVNNDIREELMVKQGDILICSRNGSRSLIGKNAIIPKNLVATFGAFMMIFRCDKPEYVRYILSSQIFSYYLGTFLTSTINQLTADNFNNMQVVYCQDEREQVEIITYLDHKCAEIDRLIAAKEQLLTELESYKKSVIYEYVTGKKEI